MPASVYARMDWRKTPAFASTPKGQNGPGDWANLTDDLVRRLPDRKLSGGSSDAGSIYAYDPVATDLDGTLVVTKFQNHGATDRSGCASRCDTTDLRHYQLRNEASQLRLARITSAGSWASMGTVAFDFTTKLNTDLLAFLLTKKTAAGSTTLYGYYTTYADPLTPLGGVVTSANSQAELQTAASAGVYLSEASGLYTGDVEWCCVYTHSNAPFMISWAEAVATGTKIYNVPIYMNGSTLSSVGTGTAHCNSGTDPTALTSFNTAANPIIIDTTATAAVGTTKYYQSTVVDAGAASFTGELLSFTWWGGPLPVTVVGDSVMGRQIRQHGGTLGSISRMAEMFGIMLEAFIGRPTTVDNQAFSGVSSAVYVSDKLAATVTSINTLLSEIVFIESLCLNDCNSTTQALHLANMTTIVNTILSSCASVRLIVFQEAPAFHLTDGSEAGRSGRDAAALKLLTQMNAGDLSLINGSIVVRGDPNTFSITSDMAFMYDDQLHLSDIGSWLIAGRWAYITARARSTATSSSLSALGSGVSIILD